MRKLFLHLTFLIISAITFAQGPVISITSPTGLTEPYSACLNSEFTFKADTAGLVNWMWDDGWSVCSEMPDFEGYSNFDKWENTYITDLEYTLTLTDEVYIWFTSNVGGGWIGSTALRSNVIHISLKGDKPAITYSDTLFCEGSTLTVDATPSDLGDGKYKWYKDGVLLDGQNNSSIGITEPATYKVEALTNETDCPDIYYTSSEVTFHYIMPEISGTFKPDLGRVTLETSIDFSSYQWQQASSTTSSLTSITGATTNTHNATISAEDIYYAVEITTTEGCVATSERVLINNSLYSIPVVNTPAETFYCRDAYVTLTLTNENFATYQWYKNGTAIYNATNASFEVGANYPGGTGTYSVKVTTELDASTELESNAIDLEFGVQPNIGIKDNAALCPGGTATLEAKPGYNGEVGGYDSYQWYFNDAYDISTAVEIAGATDSVLDINVPTESRYYFVKTTKNGCSDASGGKSIQEFFLYAPNISKTPWDGLICMGDTVTLKVYTNDVTYQWYFNGEEIDGATEKEYKAAETGYYDIRIASTICETADPVMNNDSAVIKYKFNPTFSVTPEGDQWGDNPNHRIFCGGDTIELSVDNASNYSSWQWMGKLYSVNSTSDEWVDIEGAIDSVYGFINGLNDKLRYKVRVDSVMENDVVCTAITDYKVIDQHVNASPVIASYNLSELCSEGDSTLLHLGFPGDWHHMEWYLDGELVPNTNTDTIYAKEVGMWTITCYPNTCPNIPHSSGIGPTVTIMPDAEIWENDTLIYALPQFGIYDYQWYFNNEAIDMNTVEVPWVLHKKDLKPGSYTVEVSNQIACVRESAPYIVVSADETYNRSTKIYPNPFTNEFTIEFGNTDNIESVEIFSALGQLVKKLDFVEISQLINIETEAKGIFLIKVNYTNKTSEIHKIVNS